MPGSQPRRFLFLAYRSACHPLSPPASSQFLLSPRKTHPLKSSGMASSTNPSAAASSIKWAFLCSRLSKWKRARELTRLFLLWPCVCLEVLPGPPESRREMEQWVGSPCEGGTQPWPLRPCSPYPCPLLPPRGCFTFRGPPLFRGTHFSVEFTFQLLPVLWT